MQRITEVISQELGARAAQVEAAVRLLDEGATVPFIARYRKEATGGLDEVQIREIDERLDYLRQLEARRRTVLSEIEQQGGLTAELARALAAAKTKAELEDLYLPYRPKRRTRATMARERGLEPLAETIWSQPPEGEPLGEASSFVDPERGVPDVEAALAGARDIVAERLSEDAELTGRLRQRLWEEGVLVSRVIAGKEQEGNKFSDYFDYREPIAKVPSHRALALFRGRKQGILSLDLLPGPEDDPDAPYQALIAARFGIARQGRAADDWLLETVRKAWRVKLLTRLELDLKGRVMEAAEDEAIRVFGLNLKALLLAAPAGRLPTLGLDPGLRTGVKVAVVDSTGRVAATDTIYPHPPKNQWDASIARLAALCESHQVRLISIGNGTASRETDRLARELIRRCPGLGLRPLVVSEAGASIYSASELASKELPDVDVSLRGAISIARRLQDPLAELVKVDPKRIGVGQYQHDVNQQRLTRTLDAVVEGCVNGVGVELNTASVPLLLACLGFPAAWPRRWCVGAKRMALLKSRQQLMEVAGLGAKTFEQSAGFLRIRDGGRAPGRLRRPPGGLPAWCGASCERGRQGASAS